MQRNANMSFLADLVRLETVLWNRVERALTAAGEVSLANLMGLRVLGGHGDRGRVNELSAEIGITVGAASKFVDRLERQGLVRRRPHPGDRRSSLLSLTSAGKTAWKNGEAAAEQILADLLSLNDDISSARAELARLQASLDAAVPMGVGR